MMWRSCWPKGTARIPLTEVAKSHHTEAQMVPSAPKQYSWSLGFSGSCELDQFCDAIPMTSHNGFRLGMFLCS